MLRTMPTSRRSNCREDGAPGNLVYTFANQEVSNLIAREKRFSDWKFVTLIVMVSAFTAAITTKACPYFVMGLRTIKGSGTSLPLELLKIALTMMVAYYAANINRKNKMTDVMIKCSERYDSIAETNQVKDRDEAYAYYRRYWQLKSDQLDFWMAGLVDPETIASWFFQVMESFLKKPVDPLPQGEVGIAQSFVSYIEGWLHVSVTHEALNPRLTEIIAQIYESTKKYPYSRNDSGVDELAVTRFKDLLQILERAEISEKAYIKFTSVVIFWWWPLRGKSMKAYAEMEEKRIEGFRNQRQQRDSEYYLIKTRMEEEAKRGQE